MLCGLSRAEKFEAAEDGAGLIWDSLVLALHQLAQASNKTSTVLKSGCSTESNLTRPQENSYLALKRLGEARLPHLVKKAST